MNGPQIRAGSAANTDGGGIGERITTTMDIITQCHGILNAMDERFNGPMPEVPKTAGGHTSGRSSAGLLADVIELQEVTTNLRDRLDRWVKKL